MWAEKKSVVEIYEKYVNQRKHEMLTYIIGKAYDKTKLFHFSTKHKKIVNFRSFFAKKYCKQL